MMVYRIVKSARANDLSGEGAKLYGGRWNPVGIPVIYTAQSRSLAALEALVHVPLDVLSLEFSLIEIEIPADVSVKEIHLGSLPGGWTKKNSMQALREMGYKWHYEQKYAVLKVPSVIVPEEHNLLLNPEHPELIKMKVKNKRIFKFDERLV